MDVGKYSDDGLLGAGLETGRVVAVYDGGTRPNPTSSLWIDGVWQFSPMDQIFADRMAAVRIPGTLRVVGIMLIKQMVFAVIKHQPVGIALQAAARREVKLGTQGLVIKPVLADDLVGLRDCRHRL